MASTLITTANVEAIVQSGLHSDLLDIFIDDADSEITSQFGAHPTDANDPTTTPRLSVRRGALIDLVRLSCATSGYQSSYIAGQLQETNFVDSYKQRKQILRRVADSMRTPYEQMSVGYVIFGFIDIDEDEQAIDFMDNAITDDRESGAATWGIRDLPATGSYRLYWAVPRSMPQPSVWTRGDTDITQHIEEVEDTEYFGGAYGGYGEAGYYDYFIPAKIDRLLEYRIYMTRTTYPLAASDNDAMIVTSFGEPVVPETPITPAPTPQTRQLLVGWAASTSPTVNELAAAAASTSNTATLPSGTGSLYMFIFRSDDLGGDMTEVHIFGGGNSRNLYGAASAQTINNVAGQLIVSINTFNATLLSGTDVRVV